MFRLIILILTLFLSLTAVGEGRKTLTLKEAILLAVRENPNVQQAELNLVQQKFALEVAEWQFQPHYAVTGAASINKTVANGQDNTTKLFSVQPQITLNTPIGTQLNLTSTNNFSNHFNPQLSLQIVQPLIRGFGKAIVEASLYNAMDSERISRLNVENALRITVTSVINAYLNLISALHTVQIDEDALKRAETSVDQTKLFIKAGRKAGVELITVKADVASAQTKLENDKNNLEQARYALLTAIGVNPNTQFEYASIDVPRLINQYKLPTLENTKRLTLDNDIQYQIDQITLEGSTKRNLLVAEDNTRWQLNLTANAIAGGGNGGGQNAGTNSLFNGANQSQGLQLNLTIPIDDKNAKQAVLNAKIGLKEARLALKQEKWAKETSAINGWNTLQSALRALRFAEDAEKLQQQTYKISFQKYSYGLIDSVELQSVQQQLIARQQGLLDARINYLKALVNLDQQIGHTLQTWQIKVRYL